MRLLIQRVSHASVTVDNATTGSIGRGILALVGFGKSDNQQVLTPLLEKMLQLRIFPDERGRFMHSLLDTNGELLLVPQFTLYADTSHGRRPDFGSALAPELASELFNTLYTQAQTYALKTVARGVFGAHMKVSLENDGPVTILLEA